MVKKLLDYLSIIIVIFMFLPLCNSNLPGISYLLNIWIVSFCIYSYKQLTDGLLLRILSLGLYLLFLYLFVFSSLSKHMVEIWNKSMFFKDFQAMFVALSIYVHYRNDKKGIVRLAKVAFLCIFVTMILTIIVSLFSPEYSRNILIVEYMADRLSESEINKLLYFKHFGAGTRADGFGFMLISILSGYFLRNNKLIGVPKLYFLLFIFLSLITLIQMAFAALLIFSIIFTSLSLVPGRQRILVITIFLVIIFLYVIVPDNVWADLMNDAATYLGEESSLGVRFRSIADYINNGNMAYEEGVTNRIDVRYLSAIKSFLSSPIFGVLPQTNTSYGVFEEQHLYLMNKLVVTGMVGFVLWFNIIIYFCMSFTKQINRNFTYYFYLVFIAMISYGLFKVPVSRQVWMLLFVILPGLCYFVEKRKPKVKLHKSN